MSVSSGSRVRGKADHPQRHKILLEGSTTPAEDMSIVCPRQLYKVDMTQPFCLLHRFFFFFSKGERRNSLDLMSVFSGSKYRGGGRLITTIIKLLLELPKTPTKTVLICVRAGEIINNLCLNPGNNVLPFISFVFLFCAYIYFFLLGRG